MPIHQPKHGTTGGFPSADSPRPWTTREWVVLLLLLATGGVVGWLLRFPAVLTGMDDISYLLLGQSLWEGSYREVWLVGTPLHGQYPPGMPAWLGLIDLLGGGLATLTALQLGLLAGTGYLLADALRRLGHGTVGLVTAGLVMFNPTLSYLAGTMLSEILFLAVATLALYALLRAELDGDERTGRWLALALGCALAAFLIRTIGVAVLGAVIITLLLSRRWRWAAIATVLSVVVVGGWLAYVVVASRDSLGRSYMADLNGTPLATGGAQSPGALGGLLSRIIGNLREYLVVGVPGLLALPMVPKIMIDNLIWTIAIAATGSLGLLRLARRWPGVVCFMIGTLGILLLWPWPIERLAAPLLPFGVAAILLGTSTGWRFRSSIGGGRLALLAITTALGFSALQGQMKRMVEMEGCPQTETYLVPAFCTTPEQRALVAGIRAIEQELPPSAVIATSKRPLVYLLTRRQTMPLDLLDRDVNPLAELLPQLGISHILLSRMNPVEVERVGPRLLEACDELAIAAPVDGPAVLLRLRQEGEPDACEALGRLMAWPVGVP